MTSAGSAIDPFVGTGTPMAAAPGPRGVPRHNRGVPGRFGKAVAATVTLSLLVSCSSGDGPRRPAPPPGASASAAGGSLGSTPPAKTPGVPVPSPAPSGALAVSTETLRLSRGAERPLPTTVWYPRRAGHYPLILFSHGLGAKPADYADLLSRWASAGFVVAAPAYPHTAAGALTFDPVDLLNQPADASAVITQVLTRVRTRIDAGRIAAAGHSAGGITTIGLFSGARDARLVAGVVLAGRELLPAAFTGPPAPMLFVHGRLDRTVGYADGRRAYAAVPWPKAFLSITKGGHTPTNAELVTVGAVTTDFWRWALYGDVAAKARLPRDAAEGGRATYESGL
jgi:fermentation-respiration switch protein FrsA (DUF1100 family)